jgi:ATP-dependent DNA helicase RecQ
LHSSKTFGALKDKTEDWLMALLRRCVTAGWVDFTPGERPMVLLTPAGKTVLFATGPVRLLLPPDQIAARGNTSRGASPGRTGRRRRTATPTTLDPAATALFDALRARRLELARHERVPPYVIASDRTLREMAEFRPRSIRALEGVFGIGPAKAAKYGEALLEVVRES